MKNTPKLESLSQQELRTALASLRRELFNLRLGAFTGQVKNTSLFRKLRVQIAQTLTYINRKGI